MIKIGKNISEFSAYSCQPKSVDELRNIIRSRILQQGYKCDLNDIDISLITDMSYLFMESQFNGDISRWDTSKVEDMSYMFFKSSFTGDISNWNIRKDCNVNDMFYDCHIKEEYKPKLPR